MTLSSISNLESLHHIQGNLNISEIAASSLSGLQSLTRVDSSIIINNNSQLESISGLGSITSIRGDLKVKYNPALNNIGFILLDSIMGSVNIQKNTSLVNMEGLDSLKFVGGSFSIWENSSLLDFSGLENLKSVGSFSIAKNPRNSLEGLNNLHTINGDLNIVFTGWLEDLDELKNLIKINGTLNITNNGFLKNIEGLSNVQAGSIQELIICNNWYLSSCSVKSVCDYLSSAYATINICNNDYGCNTEEEILAWCDTLSIIEKPIFSAVQAIPNPFMDNLAIQYTLREPSNVTLRIYNALGALIYEDHDYQFEGPKQFVWKAENIQGGVYYYILFARNMIHEGKLIKIE
jgi:hypothetical protein